MKDCWVIELLPSIGAISVLLSYVWAHDKGHSFPKLTSWLFHNGPIWQISVSYIRSTRGNRNKWFRARDLPPLLDNTEIWITTDREAICGRVVSPANRSRSYIVETPSGRLQRNRNQLRVVPEREESSESQELKKPTKHPVQILQKHFGMLVDLKRRTKGRSVDMGKIDLRPLYDCPRAVNPQKVSDLLKLLDFVPPVHHAFYRALTHRSTEDSCWV